MRDSDVRTLSASDDSDNGDSALINGIKNHYEKVFARAEELKLKNPDIPVIAMGHLFAKGGKVNDGDGVRALYVGTAVEIGAEIFPDFLAYAAFGHLHTPQKISRENIRYSGAPFVTDFGEAGRKKAVNVLELENGNLINIREIPVPVFQKIERVKGNLDEVFSGLDSLDYATSAASAGRRLELRDEGTVGHALVSGTEWKGDPNGGAATAWDTASLATGWQTLTSGTNAAAILKLDENSIAIEGGRLLSNATWDSSKTHVVRNWVTVPDGVTLTITDGAIVKFCELAGINPYEEEAEE